MAVPLVVRALKAEPSAALVKTLLGNGVTDIRGELNRLLVPLFD